MKKLIIVIIIVIALILPTISSATFLNIEKTNFENQFFDISYYPENSNKIYLDKEIDYTSKTPSFSNSYNREWQYSDNWEQDRLPGGGDPIVSDLNGDGFKEIIFSYGSDNGILYVLDHQGNNFTVNWPQKVEGLTSQSVPTIADVDEDPYMEIIVMNWYNITIYNHDGTIHKTISVEKLVEPLNQLGLRENDIYHIQGKMGLIHADLDNNGESELILSLYADSYYLTETGDFITVIDLEGNTLPGWPKVAYDHKETGSSAVLLTFWRLPQISIGNFDYDSDLEITYVSLRNFINKEGRISMGTRVHAVNMDGSYVSGYPVNLGTYPQIQSTPIVGDVNNDGYDEIVFRLAWSEVDDGGEIKVCGKVYVLDRDGNTLPGWPKEDMGWGYSTASLGNFNNDPYLEIAITSKDTYIFDYRGNLLNNNWPLNPAANYGTPIIADINGDGSSDLLLLDDMIDGSIDGKYSIGYYLYAWDKNGEIIQGFPIFFENGKFWFWYSWYGAPTVDDIDNDGNIDIIVSYRDDEESMNYLEVISSNKLVKYPFDWPMFRHDIYSTGLQSYIVPDQEEIPNEAPSVPELIYYSKEVSIGQSCYFVVKSEDQNADKIQYGFDWNEDDEVDEWTDYYLSGEQLNITHIWNEQGNYNVKIKARDIHQEESEWSDPVGVIMPKPKVKTITNFESYLAEFPILYKLYKLIFKD